MTPTQFRLTQLDDSDRAERRAAQYRVGLMHAERKLTALREVLHEMRRRAEYHAKVAKREGVKAYRRERAKDRATIYESVVRAMEGAME